MALSPRQIATAAQVWGDLAALRRPALPDHVLERFAERMERLLTEPPPSLRFDGTHLRTETTPEPLLALAFEQAGVSVIGHTLLPWYTATRFTAERVEIQRSTGGAWEPVAMVGAEPAPE